MGSAEPQSLIRHSRCLRSEPDEQSIVLYSAFAETALCQCDNCGEPSPRARSPQQLWHRVCNLARRWPSRNDAHQDVAAPFQPGGAARMIFEYPIRGEQTSNSSARDDKLIWAGVALRASRAPLSCCRSRTWTREVEGVASLVVWQQHLHQAPSTKQ